MPRLALRGAAVLLMLSAVAVAITYGQTLHYGFFWDDYAAFRPRPWSMLLAAWHGGWDPDGLWPVFYRPLALAYYAASHGIFGTNAWAMHLVSLLELTTLAALTGWFVRRETSSTVLSMIASVLIVMHPATPYALAAWISNQFHLLTTICVVITLLIWQNVRHRRVGVSWWMAVPILIGTLIKEDTVMVLPALVALQWIRARTVGDAGRPSARFAIGAVGAVAVYLGVRQLLLGTIGSYRVPDMALAVHNLGSGPWHVAGLLGLPAPTDGAIVASIGAVALLIAGMALSAAARQTRETALLWSGLALAGIFNLPLAFASGHTRVHLLILGISLAWTASVGLLRRLVLRRPQRVVLVAVGLAWLWLLYGASRTLAADFSPCSDFTLSTDGQVITWPMVSAETRTALMDKRASCQATTGLLIRPALEPRPEAPRR